jgi:uncharacterized protein (DUF342 family)
MGTEKSITSRGKSVKEAINIALDLLSVKKDDVDIEILENETKGMFGIGTKPAVVRITVKKQEPKKDTLSSPSMEDLEKIIESIDVLPATPLEPRQPVIEDDHLAGQVWVKDGQIFCKDAPDRYPIISPVKGLRLYKNNVLIETATIINENDLMRVELQDEIKEPSWELKLSIDKMKVTLQIKSGTQTVRKLKDRLPNNHVQLEITEEKIYIAIVTDPIIIKIKEMGITHNVDYSEIARACADGKSGAFIVATGTAPTVGKNGYFQPIQEVEIKKRLKERQDGTIDYREIQEFPSVDRGQVMGIIHPPVSGFPGTSVMSEPVFPLDVYPLHVSVGKGIILVEDGTKVVATDAGHPEIKEKGQAIKISIIPKLIIKGDATLETGNIHYIGAVEVLGSVQDGTTIDAKGDILVHKNTNMAKIIAGNSVIVKKNIISCNITAGKSNLLKAEIAQTLGEIIEQMRNMTIAIKQLSAVSAFKVSSFTASGFGPLIKILCNGKFKSFVILSTALVHKIKGGTDVLESEWTEFAGKIYNGFVMNSSNLTSEQDILKLISEAEGLYASIQDTEQDEPCFVKTELVHNSQIYSNGDIQVVGQGVYDSKLYAGGSISIDGFIRGGDVYAAKGVQIGEAGSKGGVITKISVPKDQSIKISKVMEDTIIQIGSKMHRFVEQASNVFARLGDDDQIILF